MTLWPNPIISARCNSGKVQLFLHTFDFLFFRIWIMAAGQGQGKGKGKGGTGKSSDGGKNKPKSVSRWAQQWNQYCIGYTV